MRAILIDPETKTVTEVQIDGSLHDIYKVLDCNMIEAPVRYPNGDFMYCDEEYWLTYNPEEAPCGFMFPNWRYAILGKALIVGSDDEGNDVDCVSNPAEFEVNIVWRSPSDMVKQGIRMGMV